jgi:hypothetical protein
MGLPMSVCLSVACFITFLEHFVATIWTEVIVQSHCRNNDLGHYCNNDFGKHCCLWYYCYMILPLLPCWRHRPWCGVKNAFGNWFRLVTVFLGTYGSTKHLIPLYCLMKSEMYTENPLKQHRTLRPSSWHSCFVFVTSRVQMLARSPTILTEVFLWFPSFTPSQTPR